MKKLILLSLLVSGISCTKPGCLGKAGPHQTQHRTVGTFSSIRLEDNVNLILIQGNINEAEVSGPVNLLDNITTTVSDGLLTISNNTSCTWARDPDEKITVTLTLTSFEKLEYAGSGKVTNVDTLRLDALLIESYTGAGDVELTVDNRYTGVFVHLDNADVRMHGRTMQCNSYVNSRGLMDLRDFVVTNMFIEYGGLADTHINVTGELSAILYYKGNVFYKGSPVVTKNTTYSTGKLINRP